MLIKLLKTYSLSITHTVTVSQLYSYWYPLEQHNLGCFLFEIIQSHIRGNVCVLKIRSRPTNRQFFSGMCIF